MKVAVIGCGYVGLITSVGLASKGHKVLAIDIDSTRVEKIKMGVTPFHEPGLDKVLKACLKDGSLNISSEVYDVLNCEIVLVCVQTPPRPNGAINLQILEAATRSLATVFAKKPILRTVVIRSTIIPGTTDQFVTPIFQKVAAKTHLAFNPEFLREGSAWDDFINPDRIVVGSQSAYAIKQLKRLFTPFRAPFIATTTSTAELAKYASNTFLATLVSFSNEIARICEMTPNTDVEDVLGIIHKDRRFKATNRSKTLGILSYIKAGCGFGGSCFPKDLTALIAYANSLGEEAKLLKAVEAINVGQSARIVKMVTDALGNLEKRRIVVLGAAFKGGTDDLRESPGLRIVDELLKRKAKVSIYDPLVNEKNLRSYQKKGVMVAETLKDAIKRVDACIIASNAPEFIKLNQLRKLSKKNFMIVDGRRILKNLKDSKQKYFAVGLSKNRVYIS